MKITLLTMGRTDVAWVRTGLELYISRLTHYIPFVLNEIPELKNVSALSKEQIKTKEGDILLSQIKPSDDVILLDEHGKQYRSVEFAQRLCGLREEHLVAKLAGQFRGTLIITDGQGDVSLSLIDVAKLLEIDCHVDHRRTGTALLCH